MNQLLIGYKIRSRLLKMEELCIYNLFALLKIAKQTFSKRRRDWYPLGPILSKFWIYTEKSTPKLMVRYMDHYNTSEETNDSM